MEISAKGMTDSARSGPRMFDDLESFERHHSRAGRLRRYAAGRTRSLTVRLLAAGVGVLLIQQFVSLRLAVICAAITVLAELAEHVVLLRLIRRRDFAAPGVDRLVLFATLVQAAGLSGSVVLAGLQSDAMRLVAYAFAAGAIINALLAANYHRASLILRVAVLATGLVSVLAIGLLYGSIPPGVAVTEGVAGGVLGFMLVNLFLHLDRREARMTAAERDVVIKGQEARHLALVARHAKDSVMLLDPGGRITWVNPYFTTMTGYCANEALGRYPGDLLAHPDTDGAALETLRASARSGVPASVLLLNRTRAGAAIWVDVHQTPVLGADGAVSAVVSVERDATHRVAAQADLNRALAAAQSADREKTDFLSRMSHEMRTPANAIVGGVDLLRQIALPADAAEIVSLVDDGAGRMMRLIDDILNYADISAGAVQVRTGTVDIGRLLNGVADDIRPDCARRGLSLSVHLPRGGLHVTADRLLLRRLLDKLARNAVAFTDRGGVTLIADHVRGALQVTVADSGIGIAPADQARIFDAFEQVDGGTTRSQDGAGIGLSMARDLARLLGGCINVTSTPGSGSRFVLTLPADRHRAAPHGGVGLNRMRVLVAEDNRTNRLLIERMFRGSGQKLDFAEDGDEAVAKYCTQPPDLVLMDLSMPRKDGIAATRDIRRVEAERNLRHCPIVAVTANASDMDRDRCLAAGMDGFVAKPIRKARLLRTLNEVLDRR